LQQETAIPTPPKATLTTQEIVPPSTPTKVLKTKLEVVAGVFVLMFVGTLIVIAVVDNVRRRRAGKRRVATEQETGTGSGSGADTDPGLNRVDDMPTPPPSYWHTEDASSPTRVR
jgi:hypothetical protein